MPSLYMLRRNALNGTNDPMPFVVITLRCGIRFYRLRRHGNWASPKHAMRTTQFR
jgi:hypothetical protein